MAYLLKTIISQPFYDKLRTKEQLGYLVNFGIKIIGDKVYISQKIQSEFDVKVIIKKINSFNKIFFDKIKNMSSEDWKNWKNIVKEELNISIDIKKIFRLDILIILMKLYQVIMILIKIKIC